MKIVAPVLEMQIGLIRLIYGGILLANVSFDKIFIKKLIDIRHLKKVTIGTKIALGPANRISFRLEP